MEEELIRLLEIIENAGLRKGIGKIELKNKLNQSDAPVAPDLSEKLMKEAHKSGLIKDNSGLSKPEDTSDRDDMVCVITVKGFELLNQIWIKKAIVKFNMSSDKSYEKIIDLTDKLGLSVDKLYNSSKRLENLTHALISLTIFLVVLTMILLLLEGEGIPFLGKIIIIGIIFILFVFLSMRYK